MLKSILLAGALLVPAIANAAATPPKVVFIGDQFTYGWGTTPAAFPSNWVNQGWVNTSPNPDWVHPKDPGWYNEISLWTSYEALRDWHMNTYHKHAKEWAVRSGAIMEDMITNFELKNTRLIRVCPCCALITDNKYDLEYEQKALAELCPKCGFQFPMMPETADSTAVFKDAEAPVAELLATAGDD